MSGTKSFERLLIRPANFWIERNVRTLMGRQVTAVFPEARSVELADSASLGYGKLIWATGGAPRRLACEGHDIVGVHTVRTRGDVDRIEIGRASWRGSVCQYV